VAKPQLSLVLRILAGVCTALIVLAFVSVVTTAAVVPSCGLCHKQTEFVSATKAAAHGSLACTECHGEAGAIGTVSYGFRQVMHSSAALGVSPSQYSAVVRDGRCLSCHEAINEQVSTANGLSIQHDTCAKGAACVDCHSATGHGKATRWVKSYDMDKCLHCHGQGEVSATCTTCHSERRTKDRLASGPWVVTHGPNWRSTHGMGDQLTCAACHPEGYCDKCHGPGLPHTNTFVQTHPKAAVSPKAKCTTCHAKNFCTDCHGIEMPHPPTFKAKHSSIAKKSDKVCRTCHSEQDCSLCHLLHVHPGGAVGSSSKKGAGN
jgi:hypothetical protein